MFAKFKTTFKQIILAILLSIICGTLTGTMIFIFKYAASFVIEFSAKIFQNTRENHIFLPLLVFGMIILASILYFIVKWDDFCKGAGIPNSIAIVKNKLRFNSISSIVILPIAALITFLSGVPLGNEGPSVQMGCALGKFSLNFAKKHKESLETYVLSAGMGAGFASATGAPLTAIFFAFEEIKLSASPLMILSIISATASSGYVTKILAQAFNFQTRLFDLSIHEKFPYKYVWIILVLGVLVGFLTLLFIKLYNLADQILNFKLKRLSLCLKFILIFIITAILGFISNDFIGTGHSLIEKILFNETSVWYILLIALVVRALLVAFSNKSGITGGLFLPTLALGAIIGYLFAQFLIYLGFLPEQYAIIVVIIAFSSFLGAAAKIPITAIIFALEIFSIGFNVIYVSMAVFIAYLITKSFNKKIFTLNVKDKK